eukprot:TRINITY_DN2205_c0_g1_i1.p5 TRINITY_DN2205_c0_g1~~TRINITY_DN2205_c0_g1_i1.p5  ORF type:complete len:196 (+),score=32.18 TRINITY_DN2205_c0_g1_i1:1376-1963(+)
MEKLRKINEVKQKRASSIQQQIEKRREEYFERKSRQTNGYMKKLASDEREVQNLRSQIEYKFQNKSRETPGEKTYWKEMRDLNEKTQRENMRRIQIINEHKRVRVWNSHASMEARNTENADSQTEQQCMLRSLTIREREKREKTLNFLQKVADVGVVKNESQKVKLEGLIRDLNDKFELGLRLITPRSKKSLDNN